MRFLGVYSLSSIHLFFLKEVISTAWQILRFGVPKPVNHFANFHHWKLALFPVCLAERLCFGSIVLRFLSVLPWNCAWHPHPLDWSGNFSFGNGAIAVRVKMLKPVNRRLTDHRGMKCLKFNE